MFNLMADPFDDENLLVACGEDGLYIIKVEASGCRQLKVINQFKTKAGATMPLHPRWIIGVRKSGDNEVMAISKCVFALGVRDTDEFANVLSSNNCGASREGSFNIAVVREIKAVTAGSTPNEVYFNDFLNQDTDWIRVLSFGQSATFTYRPQPFGYLIGEMVHFPDIRDFWVNGVVEYYFFETSTEDIEVYPASTVIDDGSIAGEGRFSKYSYAGMSSFNYLIFVSDKSNNNHMLRVFDIGSSSLFSLCIGGTDRLMPGPIGECEMFTHFNTSPYLSVQHYSLFFIANQNSTTQNTPILTRIPVTFDKESK